MSLITRYKRVTRGNKTFAEVDVDELQRIELDAQAYREIMADAEENDKITKPDAFTEEFTANTQEILVNEEDDGDSELLQEEMEGWEE